MPGQISTEAVGRLGIRWPVVLGPFGGGLSTPALTAIVSNKGGLGSYGLHATAPAKIGDIVQDIRALTDRPFAVNLWVSDHDPGGLAIEQAEFDRAYRLFESYFRELGVQKPVLPERFYHRFDDQVEALLAARPPAFSFVFGAPSSAVMAECRRSGIVTIGAATTIAEAEYLDDAGCDLIVASGFEAGGHRPSFLARAEDSLMGTFALTQLVAPRVKAPVISAGGIVDGRGVRAAMMLGAGAAQLGTAFLACEESGATPGHREILLSDKARHTMLTRAFSGRLARGVRNRWTDEIPPAGVLPFPIQNWLTGRLRSAAIAAGRTDLISLWGGQSAPNLRHRTAAALMESIIDELQSQGA